MRDFVCMFDKTATIQQVVDFLNSVSYLRVMSMHGYVDDDGYVIMSVTPFFKGWTLNSVMMEIRENQTGPIRLISARL
jgi:hypothetical protein